jgi:hypothetical protein
MTEVIMGIIHIFSTSFIFFCEGKTFLVGELNPLSASLWLKILRKGVAGIRIA